MADVEMTDAPTSAPATTKKGAAADGEKEGKKRFEVKKVNGRHSGLGRSAAR